MTGKFLFVIVCDYRRLVWEIKHLKMPSRTSKHRLAPPDATSRYCGAEPQATVFSLSVATRYGEYHICLSASRYKIFLCKLRGDYLQCLFGAWAQEHESYSEENYHVGKCKMLNNLTLCQLSSRGPRIKCVGQTKKYHVRTSNGSKGEIYTTTGTTAMSRWLR